MAPTKQKYDLTVFKVITWPVLLQWWSATVLIWNFVGGNMLMGGIPIITLSIAIRFSIEKYIKSTLNK